MILYLIAILILGLMCGSELNVGAFAHPALNAQTLDVHVPILADGVGCSGECNG